MDGRVGRGRVALWVLGALLLATSVFSIGAHAMMIFQAESQAPRAGAVAEWPF